LFASAKIRVPFQAMVVQICGLELTGSLERMHVGDGEPLTVEDNESLLAEVLQRPVDVDAGEARSIGDVLLCRQEIA
jgi:hypothetical protein